MFKEIIDHPSVKAFFENKSENLKEQTELFKKQTELTKLQIHFQKMENKGMEMQFQANGVPIPDSPGIVTVKASPFGKP